MWIYAQKSGRLFDAGLQLRGMGYAGKGDGKNCPEKQSIKNTGPLPAGLYKIGKAITDPHMGPLAIELEPDNGNLMLGRAGFYIHGDNATHTASEGCIIMARAIRECVVASTDKWLVVIPEIAETPALPT